MTQLACNDCNKGFKTQTGLEWHLDRIHPSASGDIEEEDDVQTAESDDFIENVEELKVRMDTIEESMEPLFNLAESVSLLLGLPDQIAGLMEMYRDLQETQNRQWNEQLATTKALELGLSESKGNGVKGATAQSNVVALAEFVKEEMLPAIAEHSHQPRVAIYPNQETISNLPKCAFCGNVRKEGRRTCG
jgi:hypothetical protein